MDIRGPMAQPDTASGMELRDAIARFESTRHIEGSVIQEMIQVDFEHLNLGQLEVLEQQEEEDGDESVDRRARRAQERKKELEHRHRQEQHTNNQKIKIRSEGEPFLKTVVAPMVGYYRFCLVASWNTVTVEMELRKASELGGVDENGHVLTYGMKVAREDEQLMDSDSAKLEGIQEEDFTGTRDKLKQLRRLLSEIQSKQSQERHRLAVHAATNEHSHSRMALNSLMETMLFMAVTGYQVYTIRRWFKGAPQLGR